MNFSKTYIKKIAPIKSNETATKGSIPSGPVTVTLSYDDYYYFGPLTTPAAVTLIGLKLVSSTGTFSGGFYFVLYRIVVGGFLSNIYLHTKTIIIPFDTLLLIGAQPPGFDVFLFDSASFTTYSKPNDTTLFAPDSAFSISETRVTGNYDFPKSYYYLGGAPRTW